MEKVFINELSFEKFKQYGSYSNMINPEGPKLGGGEVSFYRDIEVLYMGQCTQPSFSVTKIKKRKLIVDAMECHSYTGEAIMPIDGDILIHVAPATPKDVIPMSQVEVFMIPQGTMVTLNPGVWHCAPFSVEKDSVSVLVVLPERTYANDCYFHEVPQENRLEIKQK